MTPIRRLRSGLAGLRALLRPHVPERDLDDELTAFVEAAAADLVARGVEPADARRRARLALGNAAAIKEDTRATGWEHALEMLWQDARYASRALRRAPGFAATVVLTLGLGIAGNAAILGVIDTLYFSSLPVPQPERVLRLNDSAPGPSGDRQLVGMHSQNVAAIIGRTDLFAAAVAMFEEDLTITGDAQPERATVISRTSGWRATLGIAPAAGRDFTEDEERRGAASGVALVSDALWNRRFAGSRPGSAILHLNGRPFTVVGVMPPGFRFPYEADVWIPHLLNPANHGRDYAVFARLAEGRTLQQVRTAMDVASGELRARHPDELPGYAIVARTLRDNLVGSQGDTSLALLPVVGFLLVLACVNVATLLLARAVSRRKEAVMKAVLGASASRQLRQAVVEGLLLAGAGGLVGLLLAAWIAPLLVTLVPPNFIRELGMGTPHVGWRVAAASALLAIAAGAGCAALPAVAGRGRMALTLREGGRGSVSDPPRGRRMLNALVAAQLALAVLLLAGADAVVGNLVGLRTRDLGLDADGLITFIVTPSWDNYREGPDRGALARRLLDRMDTVPGVAAAGMTTVNPFGGTSWSASVIREGHDTGTPSDAFQVNHRLVTPGTFRAMRIPLLRGRDFTWDDAAGRPGVAIVSQRMARRFWPGEDAIGKRLRNARPGQPWLTVVGVVGDVADARDRSDPDVTWYLPFAQQAGTPASSDLHFMLRASSSVVPDVRRAIASIDPALAVYDVSGMDDFYGRTLERDRAGAALVSVVGAFGLRLAALGVYGVMSFAVIQRTGEIGIRVALGATRRAIMSFVFGGAARLAAAGVVAGTIGAVILRRALAAILPAVPPSDLTPPVVAAAVLLCAAAGACYLPARRAARVDPLEALRR